MTLREWLAWGEAQLRAGPHAEKARLDAEFLLLHQLGKNRAWLMAHGNEEFGGCGSIGYAALIERRRTGEPVQYITGECEFYGLPFKVTQDVLIPRPETELLVERAVTLAAQFPAGRILDIGTGSGAIAVALAHALQRAAVTSVDVSGSALEIARRNAARNGVAVRFLEGDLLTPVAGERFELIVSNPPYVPEADRPALSVEVREHEPWLALFAGADGLDVYRRLIPAAFDALAEGGWLLMEIGYRQHDAIEELMHGSGFEAIEFTPDLNGIPRVAVGRRPAR
jgi:release factor glutamine methyltransferase